MVTIYTTPTCVYCKMAKEFLKQNNVEYTEKDVAEDDAARQEAIQKSGQMGVPVIEVDGNIMVGFDKSKLSELFDIKWKTPHARLKPPPIGGFNLLWISIDPTSLKTESTK